MTTLNVRAFFFNAKTDYLPYYKSFKISVDENKSVVEILKAIQDQNEIFSFPQERIVFRINDLVVNETTIISEVVEKLGKELTIEPVNSYRSTNGLIINDDDFMQSFFLLEPYATESDKAHFETLYDLHYASETSHYQREYIGDAILVLAHKMIEAQPENKEAILKAISDVDSGLEDCEYENNLFHAQEHTETIEVLKEMLKPEVGPSPLQLLFSKFRKGTKETEVKNKTKERTPQKVDPLTNQNVAYYHAELAVDYNLIEHLTDDGARLIPFKKAYKRSGRTLIESNKELALRKAATIALKALDKGAEVLLIESLEDYEYFHKNQKAIQRSASREIYLTYIYAKDYLTSHMEIAHT